MLGKADGGEPFFMPLAIPVLAGTSALLFSHETTGEVMINVATLAPIAVAWLVVLVGRCSGHYSVHYCLSQLDIAVVSN
jgi:small neutral amino acid transporter SnatA (MarC family)